MARKRVAIVGSGCSGLAALWALNTSTEHEVHLYEADDRIGGHTNTVRWLAPGGGGHIDVDTGFIVFNMATYPNFIRFLRAVGIEAVPTEMSFGVSRDFGEFEWGGSTLAGIFAQKSNIFSLDHWRMLYDIVRFNQFALDLLHEDTVTEEDSISETVLQHEIPKPASQITIGEYLQQEGYSDAFKNNYLIPMTAAVWSTDPGEAALGFPAITLVRFMWNHHLLSTVATRPAWKTIPGGSRRYIDAITSKFPKENIHLNHEVISLEDINGKVILQFSNETEDLFDHVILACHGDQAAEIVRDSGTEEERLVLSSFKTAENIAYLHSDTNYMPIRYEAWSAWNLMMAPAAPAQSSSPVTEKSFNPRICLTYDMNTLQHIERNTYGNVLVTLNPSPPPPKDLTQAVFTYRHPQYNTAVVKAQKLLPRIQNTRGISYAGAWTKYGFHEDGFSSGLRAATEHLGAKLPFEFTDSTFSRGLKPRLGLADLIARILIWFIGTGASLTGWCLGSFYRSGQRLSDLGRSLLAITAWSINTAATIIKRVFDLGWHFLGWAFMLPFAPIMAVSRKGSTGSKESTSGVENVNDHAVRKKEE